ncbi:CBL-interacting serine/threonine-protein kinase 21 isoform X2 [Amborella trichopoda]|uniref:CBL-interacting serine/threonine-protein kinase 21 isoform X2 n=1 Tax=Amborella trichopoda TaxID=13333 RepID=UPI0009BDA3B3|nr:CBL-interacting serine/threonine-protein kinase 21 isoform X2 [Amborella trichopoda]|eukprot:XP_020523571.1 CBL-interacting serine/threonine-protein kinase 21 isoform X2 [Amborella trichopoda]
MGHSTNISKYQLGRTIGEGSFAKVKIAINTQTRQRVAVKVIDKQMVVESKLMSQVQREISNMKLLHHPNIVKIYEVAATKTKIFIVMEYISGGQLADKISYLKRISDEQARKYFQQLIDAVDYCHRRGVYHRDLKPENLLLDGKENLKVSDFGLSTLRKSNGLLSTACGSPSYLAPEVIAHRSYDGGAADIWSCGVILYELLAGYLPFEDHNMMAMYQKICKAEYSCPVWFSGSHRKLLFRILDPMPTRRMTVAEILEDEWFQKNYEPSVGYMDDESINVDDINDAFDGIADADKPEKEKTANFINAFQLIAMSNDLDLSGLFEEEDDYTRKKRFGSKHSISETVMKIEVAAKDARLSVERMNHSKLKLHELGRKKSRSYFALSAEVIEVAPTHCVVEVSKSAGNISEYKKFCQSLSNVLKEKFNSSSETQFFSSRDMNKEAAIKKSRRSVPFPFRIFYFSSLKDTYSVIPNMSVLRFGLYNIFEMFNYVNTSSFSQMSLNGFTVCPRAFILTWPGFESHWRTPFLKTIIFFFI